jgi:uncharacterized membrane protein (UPF0127 family)
MEKNVYLRRKFLCKTKIVKGLGAHIGLMLRRQLKKGDTLTLELPRRRVEIHTFFVFFPIDIFFLNNDLEVIEKATMETWKVYYPKKPAKYLLEANKGKLKISLGDKLEFKDLPKKQDEYLA